MALLEAISLTKIYKRGGQDFAALSDVALAVDKGELLVITGPSGSGKSTLLNILAGLLPPTSGQVLLEGRELTTLGDTELSGIRNNQIGYIPQGSSVLPNLSVIDNVRLPYYLQKKAGSPTEKARSLLEQMGIGPLAHQYPAGLSGGELRRVSIARGLINSPRLLIADEPTGDLDPENSTEVMQRFKNISRQGTTVILVTHELSGVEYADRHFILKQGAIREEVF